MNTPHPVPPPGRPPSRLVIGAALAAMVLATAGGFQLASARTVSFHGTVYPDAPAAPQFTLMDHRGEPASLEDHRGRAVLLFFGFTRCPDVCPLTLAKLSRLLDEMDVSPERASILLVTVDPGHDTPDRLADYVAAFGPHTTGLTGDPETLTALFREYGVYAEPAEHGESHAMFTHTTVVFGIDRGGRMRVLIRGDNPDEIVADDIRALLRLRA
jgi:protein SCO1